ncbi:MAG: integrase arm-type DNA-binding domain-containing protein [Alphaproteobacteria bacterium]|nr:integrase arm-type DNA-binding domain-containing protein [Alphaproteobacteria bacterium]
MARAGKMTALKVARIARAKVPGYYGDGGGLFLQVSRFGTGSWVFRYRIGGRLREMGLGSLDTIGLAGARERARKAREQRLDGYDPIELRKAARLAAQLEAAKAIKFQEAARQYVATNKVQWKHPKHAMQWEKTLESYVFPVFGDLAVGAVDTGLVLRVVEPIWTIKPETASRVRGRIETILDWAAARGYRDRENPARWRGHLNTVLPSPANAKRALREKKGKDEHHPALPYADLPAFIAELKQRKSTSAYALEYVVLTAVRTETVLGSRAREIDFAKRVWTIPAGRPGLKRPGDFRVPLSDDAIAVLRAMRVDPIGDPDRYLFPGSKPGKPLTNILKYLKEDMRRPNCTVHGFRSTFRDWVGDCTDFPGDLAELALAHTLPDKTEAAYRRQDALERRRVLMNAWAGYCAGREIGAHVISLKRA